MNNAEILNKYGYTPHKTDLEVDIKEFLLFNAIENATK